MPTAQPFETSAEAVPSRGAGATVRVLAFDEGAGLTSLVLPGLRLRHLAAIAPSWGAEGSWWRIGDTPGDVHPLAPRLLAALDFGDVVEGPRPPPDLAVLAHPHAATTGRLSASVDRTGPASIFAWDRSVLAAILATWITARLDLPAAVRVDQALSLLDDAIDDGPRDIRCARGRLIDELHIIDPRPNGAHQRWVRNRGPWSTVFTW